MDCVVCVCWLYTGMGMEVAKGPSIVLLHRYGPDWPVPMGHSGERSLPLHSHQSGWNEQIYPASFIQRDFNNYDTYITSSDTKEIKDWLNCRDDASCTFSTVPLSPYSYTFILQPLRMPFRLSFSVKAEKGAMIALAREKMDTDTFAEISLGGWGNTKSMIRPCREHACDDELSVHDEVGILNDTEFRPFWQE